MSRRQLAALFTCILIPFTLGSAMIGLLPIYLTQLGADPASVGNDFALMFLALAVGTMGAGWLSDRFQRRKALYIVMMAAQIPLFWLTSQTTQVGLIVALLAASFVAGGVATGLVNILAGLFASDTERGKVFGILGVAINLGAMLGGMLAGFVVQHWGFSTLFAMASVLNVSAPIAGCFLEDKAVVRDQPGAASTDQTRLVLGVSFYLLLLACLFLNTSNAVVIMGRPLIMDKEGFDSAAIASVISVGGAVSIPVPLMLGWLSDHLGRFRLLVLSFLATGLSVALIAVAIILWHYWFAALLYAALGAGNAIASALVTDLVPPQGLSTALARLGAMNWAGSVVGFIMTGYVIAGFGLTSTFLIGGLLPVIGILLLVRLRPVQPKPAPS